MVCPVEDSLRCFMALCTLLLTLWLPAALPERLLPALPALLPVLDVCAIGMGAARSAAMDRESRLSAGFSLCRSLSSVTLRALTSGARARTSTEVMFRAIEVVLGAAVVTRTGGSSGT